MKYYNFITKYTLKKYISQDISQDILHIYLNPHNLKLNIVRTIVLKLYIKKI